MKITKAEYSHIGGRKENEDSYLCEILNENSAYAIVCDGLGGHGGGRAASRAAVKHLSKARYCNQLPNRELITQWMQETNREIAALRSGNTTRMKSTAVFLAVNGCTAVWAHIGDSRLYHFYNGALVDYTEDHSVPQMMVQAGELTRDQIPDSPDRNRVLKVLGSEELKPEIEESVLLPPGKHAFLLCTDGLWEYLQDAEIRMDLLKSRNPAQWLMYLRSRSEERKKASPDNNTAVAMFVEI